jgi:hypothetical protein
MTGWPSPVMYRIVIRYSAAASVVRSVADSPAEVVVLPGVAAIARF